MARQTPSRPSNPILRPEVDEGFAPLGEKARRLALGLTATLLVMRAYWPSEDAATGTGLTWVCATLVVLAIAIIAMLLGGMIRFRRSWVDAAFLLLVLLVGLSATGAQERRVAINLAWEWGGIAVIYVLARCLPRTRGESEILVGLLAATAVALAGYGLFQVTFELPAVRRIFNANPADALRRLGIEPGSAGDAMFRNRLLSSREPFSTFALANSLAGFLVGPLALGLAVAVDNMRREGRGSRVFAVALATIPGLVLLVCLLLTKSRSAWAGLAVAGMVILWRARGNIGGKTILFVGAGLGIATAGLVAGLFALGQLDREVITQAKKSLGYRLEYWAGTWDILRDASPPFPPPSSGPLVVGQEVPATNPEARAFWHGLGPGNFGGPYLRHKRPEASEEISDPHNLLLDVWTTAGLPALLTLLVALGLGFWETTVRAPAPLLDAEAIPPTELSAPPRTGAYLVPFGAAAWVAVVAFGKLNPFEGDLLWRWLVIGLGWIVAVGLGSLLWGRRPIPAAGVGIAVLAITINLLAAGGIGMPAVALPLWTLLALGLNLRDDRPCGRLRERSQLGWGIGAAVAWAAVVGAFAGAIGPFWLSEIAVERGEAAMRAKPPAYEIARTEFRRAIDVDKANVRPLLDLAELESLYMRSPEARMRSEVWERIFLTLDLALERPWRNSNSLAIRRLQANYARQVLQAIPDPTPRDLLSLRSKLVRANRKAADLYPTSALFRAQLARSSAEIGMYGDAVGEANQALKLHDLTPHPDKKLPDELLRELRAKLPDWTELRDHPPAPPK